MIRAKVAILVGELPVLALEPTVLSPEFGVLGLELEDACLELRRPREELLDIRALLRTEPRILRLNLDESCLELGGASQNLVEPSLELADGQTRHLERTYKRGANQRPCLSRAAAIRRELDDAASSSMFGKLMIKRRIGRLNGYVEAWLGFRGGVERGHGKGGEGATTHHGVRGRGAVRTLSPPRR